MPRLDLSPEQIAEQVARIGTYDRITSGELERAVGMTVAARMLTCRNAYEVRWLLWEWFLVEAGDEDE